MKKRLTAFMVALAMLAGGFALPGRGLGDTLAVAFETAETRLPRGESFTLGITLAPTGADISALRLYVLYDSARFAWEAAETERLGVVASGMFARREAGGESGKYPLGMPAADRANYGVIVLQWSAEPAGGVLPAIPAGTAAHVLTLGFTVKADAPLAQPGGRIFVSTDYTYANTPWFNAGRLAVDASAGDLTVQPMPPVPAMSTGLTIDGGFIYGFPDDLPQVGGTSPWRDSALGQYFTVTNGGILELVPPDGNPLAGTGTKLRLWNANETQLYGEYTLIVFGDIDGNFVVDFDDWAMLKAMLAGGGGGPVGTDPHRFAADINGDGTIDAGDLQALYDAARGVAAISQRG